jgi:hypothetical protein
MIVEVTNSLEQLSKAIDGLVSMSNELDEVFTLTNVLIKSCPMPFTITEFLNSGTESLIPV